MFASAIYLLFDTPFGQFSKKVKTSYVSMATNDPIHWQEVCFVATLTLCQKYVTYLCSLAAGSNNIITLPQARFLRFVWSGAHGPRLRKSLKHWASLMFAGICFDFGQRARPVASFCLQSDAKLSQLSCNCNSGFILNIHRESGPSAWAWLCGFGGSGLCCLTFNGTEQ